MGEAYIVRRGGGSGGSAALNFKIVGGTTQPSSPTENTIWVNTDTAITDWAFSVDAPASPAEGMVWIKVGSVSNVPFNALKKNNITVYPISAKQYIGGAWVDKTAQSYQGSVWVSWIEESVLYSNGLFNPNIAYDSTKTPASLVISYDADCISVATTQYATSYGYVRFGPVNVAKYSSLAVEVSNPGSGAIVGVAFVSNSTSGSVSDAIADVQTSIPAGTTRQTLTLDISSVSSESCYVYVGFSTGGVASTINGQVHSVKLEE